MTTGPAGRVLAVKKHSWKVQTAALVGSQLAEYVMGSGTVKWFILQKALASFTI
jgi:hypothetical protein